ncbi:MAG: TRAP transporter large permease subunit [Rhodovulum sp.]
MEVAVLFSVFVLKLIVGIPPAITLGISSLSHLFLAGNPMKRGGITERIIRFAKSLMRWIRGGLSLPNMVASMPFGGNTGTAVADAASLGVMPIPGINKAGYLADSSAAAPAMATALATLRSRGNSVQVGLAGDTPVPLKLLVGKEIIFQGMRRFDREFARAVATISEGRLDVRPIVIALYPIEDAIAAFEGACDR